jgi:hypothetical protein
MQICISGRRRSLNQFPELGFDATLQTSVRHDQRLDSATRWRAERHKNNTQIERWPSVVQKMIPSE